MSTRRTQSPETQTAKERIIFKQVCLTHLYLTWVLPNLPQSLSIALNHSVIRWGGGFVPGLVDGCGVVLEFTASQCYLSFGTVRIVARGELFCGNGFQRCICGVVLVNSKCYSESKATPHSSRDWCREIDRELNSGEVSME